MLAAEPAVQHQHRLAAWLAHRAVADLQLGHHIAGVESKVAQDRAALLGRRIVGR
jgi:hypothetical protein